jgi:hypothetical protein
MSRRVRFSLEALLVLVADVAFFFRYSAGSLACPATWRRSRCQFQDTQTAARPAAEIAALDQPSAAAVALWVYNKAVTGSFRDVKRSS